MLLGDMFEESFNQFFLENESEEISSNCDEGMKTFAEDLSRSIKQGVEKMYKEKEEEKTYHVIIKYKNLKNESKECEVKFKSRFYPEEIGEDEPEIELEVSQKEIGIIAVDGIDKEKFAKESVKEFAKANAKVHLSMSDVINNKWLNLKGSLYLKIAGVVIVAVAAGYALYKVLPKEKIAKAYEATKAQIEKSADAAKATIQKDYDKAKDVAEKTASNIKANAEKTAANVKEHVSAKMQEVSKELANLKVNIIQSLEHLSKLDIAIGASLGTIIAVVIVNKIIKMKRTKKEMYELSILLSNFESYMIVNDIIASKSKIKYENDTANNTIVESIKQHTDAILNSINHFIASVQEGIGAFMWTHEISSIDISVVIAILTFIYGFIISKHIMNNNIKAVLIRSLQILAILTLIIYGYPSSVNLFTHAYWGHNAFSTSYIHNILDRGFITVAAMFALIGIGAGVIVVAFKRVLQNAAENASKIARSNPKLTLNDIEQEFKHQIA